MEVGHLDSIDWGRLVLIGSKPLTMTDNSVRLHRLVPAMVVFGGSGYGISADFSERQGLVVVRIVIEWRQMMTMTDTVHRSQDRRVSVSPGRRGEEGLVLVAVIDR